LHNDRSELDRTIKDRDQARADLDQRWKETNQLKGEINHYKQDIEALKSREDQLKSELETIRSEKDQALNLHRDIDHYKATIRLKDDEIAFLRSHLSQLSEKITPALPPGEEEIKKKGWWQFWR